MPFSSFIIGLDVILISTTTHYSLQASYPMPARLAHALGQPDDTEAHTSTRQRASNADGAGTGTTPREPLLASARVARAESHTKCTRQSDRRSQRRGSLREGAL